jgi:hypothetical protein
VKELEADGFAEASAHVKDEKAQKYGISYNKHRNQISSYRYWANLRFIQLLGFFKIHNYQG